MEPHQERVITGREALQPMVVKLHNFINGPNFGSASEQEQQLLKTQLGHMQGYLDTLGERIKLHQQA